MDAFVLEGLRTPLGKARGQLAGCRPDDLAALLIRALMDRSPQGGSVPDEVVFGATNQAGEDNRNVARMALLLAGLPYAVPGVTVNRLCGSGLEAVIQAARLIRAGDGDCVLAGGVESMSRAPFALARPPVAFPRGNLNLVDTALGWRFENPKLAERFELQSMGRTGENVAEKYGVSREDQDAFALSSHEKAVRATDAGSFHAEIVPVELPATRKRPAQTISVDEGPRRDTTVEKLRALPPVFLDAGTVTAGNASPLSDGAAALLLGSEQHCKTTGATPLARFIGAAVAGVEPNLMGTGPIDATQKLFAKTGFSADDFDLVELNEAFASQALACIRALRLDPAKVNVRGGAIALGHPIGCSGARIVVTLLHAMRQTGAKRGLATCCIGVGQGLALALERV